MSEKHDSDRELIGQGLANIIVPYFGEIPATGAIARTAINVRSGGKTPLSGEQKPSRSRGAIALLAFKCGRAIA